MTDFAHFFRFVFLTLFYQILRFVVFFQLISNARRSIPNKSENESDIADIRKKELRVLIVDDEKPYREAMRFLLEEKYNAVVKTVESGVTAIKLAENGHKYDIIFLDIMMPETDGLETYAKLIDLHVTSNIVMMSAFSNSEKWSKAEKMGIELTAKPIPENRLSEILSRVK